MSLSLSLPPSSLPPSSQRPITAVQVHPLVVATALDAHLRRNPSQDRVFLTLLGSRNPQSGNVEVKNAFTVPYEVRSKGQVTIDMDHHRAMLDLSLKVAPRETVVGWAATSPLLNSFTALIHSFYTSEVSSSPSPAVHLTIDPSTLALSSYTASPIGLSPSNSAAAFTPVSVEVSVKEHDRPALELLSANLTLPAAGAQEQEVDADVPVTTPLSQLTSLLAHVSAMLEQTISYVRAVVEGEKEGDAKVGRELLKTVGSVPAPKARAAKGEKAGEGEEKIDGFEEEFNAHLADVLMVSYLSNVIKTQSEIAGRLGLML
ncbi:hypothetical protein JCM10213_003453 [Rhodosporidiobolus nylandii]